MAPYRLSMPVWRMSCGAKSKKPADKKQQPANKQQSKSKKQPENKKTSLICFMRRGTGG